MNKTAITISSILLGALFAQQAIAQSAYSPNQRRFDPPVLAQAGAGGRGGSGGGAEGRSTSARGADNSPHAYRMRTSSPPPMDPTRLIVDVDCTRPFDPFRGNIRCI